MNKQLLTLILGPPLLAGCLHGGQRDRPFTRDWVRQVNKERELADRKAYIRGDGDLVLLGGQNAPRTALVTDEKGRPRLKVGRDSGWSGDLNFRGGRPDVKLKYKLKWKGARPRREKAPGD